MIVLRFRFTRECGNELTYYSGNELTSYERICKDYQKALNKPGQTVLFECGATSFFRPLGVNLLTSMIRGFLNEETRTICFTPPTNDDCDKYLQSQGFYKEFNIQQNTVRQTTLHNRTNVGLYRSTMFEPTYFEHIASWLNTNLQYAEKEIQAIEDVLHITLAEIFNNVIDHSQSPTGYYVSAQAYHNEKCLMLSVVDMGIGFHETLAPRYKRLANNQEAIECAIEYGVSSKSKPSNAGAGLDTLAGAMKEHRGHLEIVSQDGVWRQQPDGTRSSSTLPFSFPGTCINIRLDNSGIDEFIRTRSTEYG